MPKMKFFAEHKDKKLAVQFAVLWGSEVFDSLYFVSVRGTHCLMVRESGS